MRAYTYLAFSCMAHFAPPRAAEELGAVQVLWEQSAVPRGVPIIMFNAELDRVRAGYYPPLFFPSIKKWADTLLPKVRLTRQAAHNASRGRLGGLDSRMP